MTESSFPLKDIRFALGDGNNLGRAKNLSEPLTKFADRFRRPLVTSEKRHEYLSFPDMKQAYLKGMAGWFMRAHVEAGKRTRDSIHPGDMLTFDVDYATPEWQRAFMAGEILPGYALFGHTTRSHTPEKPRFRIALPLTEPLPTEMYPAACRIIGQIIDPKMEYLDKVSARVAQMMYLPTCSQDMEEYYVFHEQGGQLADWRKAITNWEVHNGPAIDLSNLPRFAGEGELREAAEKAEDPLTKDGPIGTFCRAYSITELVEGKDGEEAVLGDYYEVTEHHQGEAIRMTYLKGTTSNGAVAYDDKHVYSHHGSDPAQDQLMNAYDLVRYHLFDALSDDDEAPMKDRSSVKGMGKWMPDQPAYRTQQVQERYDLNAMLHDDADQSWMQQVTADEAAEALLGGTSAEMLLANHEITQIEDLLGVPAAQVIDSFVPRYQRQFAGKPPENWVVSELELTDDGKIKPTLHNVATVVRNDARFWRKIAYNEFSNQVVLLADIKTNSNTIPNILCTDKSRGMNWSDIYDITIRAIIESPNGAGKAGYGFKVTDRDLISGVQLAARNNAFHPIREKIEAWRGTWDGVDRVGTFLHRFLGAAQNQYTADVMKMMLCASIARIETPGCKFDYAAILEGIQGIGKSTLLKVIYGEDYFGELDVDLNNRQQVAEQIAGKWCLELPELSSLHKADHNHAKQFMRRQDDDVREAYGRSKSILPRQNVIWGTTNDKKYLRDPTGNRSYWPVACSVDEIDLKAVLAEKDQLWAQAVMMYDEMRQHYPTGDLPLTLTGWALEEAKRLQESARTKEMWENWADNIAEWMDEPVVKNHVYTTQGWQLDPMSGDEMVLRCGCTQGEVFTSLLNQRAEMATNAYQNVAWQNALSKLEQRGWQVGTQCRIRGKNRNWLIPPDRTEMDRLRGYVELDSSDKSGPQITKPEDLL